MKLDELTKKLVSLEKRILRINLNFGVLQNKEVREKISKTLEGSGVTG